MPVSIYSLATAAPPNQVRQSDVAEVSKTFFCRNNREARLLSAIFQRSEVKTRGSVVLEPNEGAGIRQQFYPGATGEDDRGPTTLDRMRRYELDAPKLAIRAAREALISSGLAKEQVTHLITVTCTGFYAPGVDIALIKQLELRPTVRRLQVGFMGCHGAINGLRAAEAIAGSDADAGILLCAVELCSLHFYYGWDVEKVKANALFADGAGALIAGAQSRGMTSPWRVAATGSCLLPDSEEEMSWRIGNHGFEMTLTPRVMEAIETHLRGWLVDWLGTNGLGLEQIRSWAIHPGGPRIVSSVAESLQLSEDQVATSRAVLAEHGNMSSPTILFILDRLKREGAALPCVALGFGPGVVAEAALLVE